MGYFRPKGGTTIRDVPPNDPGPVPHRSPRAGCGRFGNSAVRYRCRCPRHPSQIRRGFETFLRPDWFPRAAIDQSTEGFRWLRPTVLRFPPDRSVHPGVEPGSTEAVIRGRRNVPFCSPQQTPPLDLELANTQTSNLRPSCRSNVLVSISTVPGLSNSTPEAPSGDIFAGLKRVPSQESGIRPLFLAVQSRRR